MSHFHAPAVGGLNLLGRLHIGQRFRSIFRTHHRLALRQRLQHAVTWVVLLACLLQPAAPVLAYGADRGGRQSSSGPVPAPSSLALLVSRQARSWPHPVSSGQAPRVTGALTAAASTVIRVSVATDGTQANQHSWQPAVSGDGRYVAFDSSATNLVAGDTNNSNDVFVHDCATGETVRVSVASDGTQGNGYAQPVGGGPGISTDGRFVVFCSEATNLVSGDTNDTYDVFVHDRLTHQTTLVSTASDGTRGDYGSQEGSISADGRYVAFSSYAGNLVPGDTNGVYDAFVHDRLTGQTTRISVASDGTQGNGHSGSPSISADGRYVAFGSVATNLVAGETMGGVFVHDRATGETARASFALDGTPSAGSCPRISSDGRIVAYYRTVISGFDEVFAYDRETHETTCVSVAADGTEGNGYSWNPSISSDGRYIAFFSSASNLVANDTNGQPDIFVRDRLMATTTLASLAADGTQANSGSGCAEISADGQYVAFRSLATNLVPGDTNHYVDIFLAKTSIPADRFCAAESECLSASKKGTQPDFGDPVNSRTGNFTHQEVDFSIPTRGLPLTLERSYNSLDTDAGPFGRGWTHSYNVRLITSTYAVTLVAPRGSRLPFHRQADGSFDPGPGVRATLAQGGDGTYTLTQGDQVVYRFDAGGRLVALDDGHGNATTLTYTGNDLTRITAPDGRALTLRYELGRIVQVTDPLSRTMHYSYTADCLMAVSDRLGETWRYDYDAQGRMATLTDPTGHSLTNEYDGAGRVIVQRDKLSQASYFAYHASSSVVTDTSGVPITYTYNAIGILTSVTDVFGHTTRYEHDENYNVTAVTDPLGHSTRYTWNDCGCAVATVEDALGSLTRRAYDAHNNLLSETDALTRTTRYAYDAHDNLTVITNSLGITATFSYNAFGQLIASSDPNRHRTEYGYDAYGNLAVVTDTLGHASHLDYDLAGQLIAITDAKAHTTRFEYDAAGRLITTTDALEGQTVRQYDALGNLIRLTDANGHATAFAYDAAGRLITTTDALNGQTVLGYDAAGRATRLTDANGHATAFAYDAAGRLITTTDSLGGRTVRDYDLVGRLIRLTDANGKATRYGYDALGRLITRTDALNGETLYAYDAVGNLLQLTDALGKRTTFAYDGLDRTVAITDTLGHATWYGYDAAGNRRFTLDPTGVLIEYTYDELNRPQGVSGPLGAIASYGHDAVGNLTSLADANGHVTRYTYDPLNRLKTVLDPLNGLTTYDYDPAGNLRTATDAREHTTTYTYDPLNRLETVAYPLAHVTAYGYDAVGNTTVITDADHLVTHLTYDSLDRLTCLQYPDAPVSYAYDRVGNRLAMTDTTGLTLYAYDDLYRPLTITAPYAGAVGYRYDAVGRRTQTLYPTGEAVSYGYDDAGRLARVTDWAARPVTYTYDDAGRLQQALLPNGVTTDYGYDAAGRLLAIAHRRGDDWQTRYDYGLDPAGNRIAITETTTAVGPAYAFPVLGKAEGTSPQEAGSAPPYGQTIRYTYDDADRLTAATYANGDRYQYTYDPVGNRTALTVTLQALETEATAYAYDDADRLTAVDGTPVTHDNRGNLLSDGTWTYSYNAAGRMVRAEAVSTTHVYTYNGDGLLVAQNIDGVETAFTWDQALALPQVLATSRGLRSLYGLERLAVAEGGAWYYPQHDALGSVRQWTDAAGAVIGMQAYGPYGEPFVPLGPPLAPWGFAGEWQDPMGLVYLRARWYNPALGRFSQVDPALGSLTTPATRHSYLYAKNAPLRYADPSGRQVELPFVWVWGFMRGAVDEYNRQLGGLEDSMRIDEIAWYYAAMASPAGEQPVYLPIEEWDAIDWGAVTRAGTERANTYVGTYLAALLTKECASQTLQALAWTLFGGKLLERYPQFAPWVGRMWNGGRWLQFGSLPPVEGDHGPRDDVESLLDWDTYPENPSVPRPTGPFRLLEGEEYERAREAADAANRAMHRANPNMEGLRIHEVHPVKWGGDPTDPANKVSLTPEEHRAFTEWWNAQMRRVMQMIGR